MTSSIDSLSAAPLFVYALIIASVFGIVFLTRLCQRCYSRIFRASQAHTLDHRSPETSMAPQLNSYELTFRLSSARRPSEYFLTGDPPSNSVDSVVQVPENSGGQLPV
ncbi:hypothetical protein SISNIDRAFT_454328 [Sistotremastrum niveocremeum HHB9708]|uniref:Uncharacterized protein n=1 Tax=Sistotremastrum niveocremeum HHB9708 TaxID=1314777 RepID=A0A164V751_9AGAM|nr:hypothetical protein SISNIDRAFT_454328 [Sistotremastrum niveocremeum HHB9708]